jgi:hypothetical protein
MIHSVLHMCMSSLFVKEHGFHSLRGKIDLWNRGKGVFRIIFTGKFKRYAPGLGTFLFFQKLKEIDNTISPKYKKYQSIFRL